MKESCPGKETVTPPAESNLASISIRKKTLLSEPRADNRARAFSDQVDPVGRAKGFIWRKLGPPRRVSLPSQKGDPPRSCESFLWPSQIFASHVKVRQVL